MAGSVSKALFGVLALLVVSACATSASKYAYAPWNAAITEPGDIYSSFYWDTRIEEALTIAGRADEIPEIKAHAEEDTWPKGLGDITQRINHPELLKAYKGEVIARFMLKEDTPVVVFHVPAAKNAHQPEGWRPAEDIYIVLNKSAVTKAK